MRVSLQGLPMHHGVGCATMLVAPTVHVLCVCIGTLTPCFYTLLEQACRAVTPLAVRGEDHPACVSPPVVVRRAGWSSTCYLPG